MPQPETPRASHSNSESQETLPYDSEEDSELEYVDVDTWVEWFKTTDEYKELKKPGLDAKATI